MLKNLLFLSRRATRTAELLGLGLAEKQHPNCDQK
jgi:hypothetical protein